MDDRTSDVRSLCMNAPSAVTDIGRYFVWLALKITILFGNKQLVCHVKLFAPLKFKQLFRHRTFLFRPSLYIFSVYNNVRERY